MEYIKPSTTGFTVYSKSGCPNCVSIKKVIKEKTNLFYSDINCDDYILQDKEDFLHFIDTLIGHACRKFPMVFYEGKFIGGLNETKLFIDNLLLSFEENF
jgi:glutaredoxin